MRSVSVWLLATGQPAATVAELAGVLDAAELARAAAMTEPDVHAEFVVSHAASRLILAEQLGVPAAALRWRYGRSGKPELAEPVTDLRMSLSHSDGLAAVAVCAGRAVGIDLQRRRHAAGLVRMAERYYPPAEARYVAQAAADPAELGRRFSTLWTRKEACAKVGGGRLIPTLAWPSRQPADAESADPAGPFRSGGDGEPVLIRDLAVPDGSQVAVADGSRVAVPGDFHAAVAVAGTEDFEVVLRWWQPTSHAEPLVGQIGVPMAVPGC